MKKHTTTYESDIEMMADQPTVMLVLFGIGMILLAMVWRLFKR